MERNEILKSIKQGISLKGPEARVYLFGSRARGDNHHDSDWGIPVITSKERISLDYELELRDDPIVDIELETGQVIGMVVYSSTDWESRM